MDEQGIRYHPIIPIRESHGDFRVIHPLPEFDIPRWLRRPERRTPHLMDSLEELSLDSPIDTDSIL